MSTTIRVPDDVRRQLDELRDWRETYAQVIERLLAAREAFCQIIDILEGNVKFREWQREKLEKQEAANRRRDSAQVPTV